MSIEVHVRVRPGVSNPVWSSAETVLYSTANTNTRYVYNKVHPSNSSNLTIFQGIEAIVHAAFDGKNVTVMAYGQTGSGKTYSMIGTDEDQGIVPRTARLLLELKRTHPGTTVQAYYTEIYNESVKDLLEPQRGELTLHDAADGGVTFDKRMVLVESFDDFLRLQSAAERNRKYGVTNLNDHSSRSHIILTFEIHRAHRSQRSVINLVDLAGSESAARANTEGATLREGGFINRSLLTLGNVVDAIVEKRPYVPYRDAKLTRILRTCLGGTGITFILCCVNPSRDNYEQTVTSLRFTQRAMKIKNDPVVVLNMPPLFTHQYARGASQITSGMKESAEAEYQKGLRDAYMFCNNTAGSVVGNFQSQVADSVHALANAQRLLVAHDHAMGMDRVGRLHNQLNELARQRGKNQDLVESESKRQRELDDEVEHRKTKLARLEAELTEKEAATDTDLAGWEYQLHEARQKQVREVDLLLRNEETRRARIGYEWSVCIERIATRYVPTLVNSLTAATTAAIHDAQDSQDGQATAASTTTTTTTSDAASVDAGAVVGRGTSKAIASAELREKLRRARAELADLELAHEMVREDVEQAHRAQRNNGGTTGSSNAADDGDGAMAPYRSGASNAELSEQIAALEEEERQLREQAKREIRRESLRQVRESLRRSSRSPQSGKLPGSRSLTPQAKPSLAHGGGRKGRSDETAVYDSPDGDDDVGGEDVETDAEVPRGEGDGEYDERRKQQGQRYRQPTTSSSSRQAAVASRGRNARSSRSRSNSTRDSYADGVRNALSVIDSLRNRLKLQRQEDHNSNAGAHPHSKKASHSTGTAQTRQGRHADSSATPERGDDIQEPTFLDMFGGGGQSGCVDNDSGVGNGDDEKENYYGYQSRPAQAKGHGGKTDAYSTGRGYQNSNSNRNRNRLEMIAEDDEAFASPSPGDVTPPIVGIAARRKWDRQTSSRNSNPPPQHLDVERALYPLHSNSQSAERRSRSRRGY